MKESTQGILSESSTSVKQTPHSESVFSSSSRLNPQKLLFYLGIAERCVKTSNVFSEVTEK